MSVHIPAEFQPFVATVISSGRFNSETEVVGEALRLLKNREELIRAVNLGVEQINRGEYTTYNSESLADLAAEIKREGREILDAE